VDARCRIELLGGLRVRQGEREITRFPMRRTAALLAYLAYYLQRGHSREVLVELLWPECDVEAGRSRLSVVLSSVRALLEPAGVPPGSVLVADRFSVGLNPLSVTTDVAEFEAAVQSAGDAASVAEKGPWLTRAVELYGGTLLPEFLDDWVVAQQQRLNEQYFQVLRQLVEHLEGIGELDRALQVARRAVAADPLREEAHGELMRLQIAAGQPSAALRQYRELERLLKQELDTVPGAAARALVQKIEAAIPPPGETPRPAADSRPQSGERMLSRPPPAPPTESTAGPALRPDALEPVGGAVPLDSRFYVVRPADHEFGAAMARRDSIVLVKGPRQVGKTSLLARGLQQARQAGARVVLTDLEMLNAAHLGSAETFLLELAQMMADQLDLDVSPADVWDSRRGANPNFRRYVQREVLGKVDAPLVWGLDEVDRLFHCSFGSDIFGLFRSWHNERALDPAGPWMRLTLAMAYATEAHLFIADLNQSPFNVGTQVTLADFTREQVADLNRRYGSPLKDEGQLSRFDDVISGHPDLVRRGLYEMAAHGTDIATFETRASSDDWIFGNHLQRILLLLRRDPELCEVVRGVLAGRPCLTPRSFYRLRSAGLMVGVSEEDARLRCRLYGTYLQRHLQ
jgi:DNA-binding SARP family transcriptional activator